MENKNMDKQKILKVLKESEDYYIAAFKKLEETGENTWNWAACLMPGAWLVYRKMFLVNLIFNLLFYVVVSVVSLAITSHMALPDSFSEMKGNMWFMGWIIFMILMGKFGNKIYYSRVKKNIKRGYHLCGTKYRPTSFWTVNLGVLAFPVTWIHDRFFLKPSTNEISARAITEENLRAVISEETRENYYLQEFEKIEKGKISLNWAACFCSIGWLIYRRMYLAGVLLGICNILTVLIISSSTNAFLIFALYTLVTSLAMLFGANCFYYRFCSKRAEKL
jgi:hypothetical protein